MGNSKSARSLNRAQCQAMGSKVPRLPYNLVTISNLPTDETFPPKFSISAFYNPRTFKWDSSSTACFSLDLPEAVKRHTTFAEKITQIYHYDVVPEHMLLAAQNRYVKFMNLIRLKVATNLVPAMDIDLMWHTHQLSKDYLPWCLKHIGFYVNHDDTIGQSDLDTGLEDTISAFAANFGEDYLLKAHREPSSNWNAGPRTTLPSPTLTKEQRTLWDFDVQRQIEHEQRYRQYLSAEAKLAAVEEEIFNLRKSEPTVEPSYSSTKPSLLKRLSHSLRTRSALKDAEKREHSLKGEINVLVAREQGIREDWGRKRFPLLVLAMKSGDNLKGAGFQREEGGFVYGEELPGV